MAIKETVEFEIDAPASLAYALLLDVESLPQWSGPHQRAVVLERDAAGNPSRVEIEAGLLKINDTITFRYEFTPETGVSWESEGPGTAVKSQGGFYRLTPLGDDKVGVVAEMSMDLKVKLPGFLVKQGIKTAAEIASKGFTAEVLRRKAAL